MEENRQQYQDPTGATGSTSNQGLGGDRKAQSTQELMDDLNRLGMRFAEVVQTAWESDERKRLEKDVKAGVVSLVNGLERGLRKVGESEHAKEFLNKAEDVAETIGERIRTSPTSHEMAGHLAKGLRILAEQIDKFAEDLRKSANTTTDATPTPPPAPMTGDSQDIPITRV